MFRKHFSIQIDNPCHENWENMLPAEQGRFCNSCSKQVIDFTSMSDAEIVFYFKHHENICGRLHSGQLDRNLLPYTRKQSIFSKAIAAAVLLFQSFLAESQTQNIKPQSVIEQISQTKKTVTPDCSKLIPGDSGSFVIDIKVRESHSISPIDKASIFINGDSIACFTMINGMIRIELPVALKDSIINLTVSKEGYITYSHDVILDTNYYIVDLVKKDREKVILGGMIRTKCYNIGEKKKDSTKDLYRKYPGLFRDF